MMTSSNEKIYMPDLQSKGKGQPKPVKWRVGTLSMGGSLLIVGIIILWMELSGEHGFNVSKTWWPIYFVLLGLEILIHSLARRSTRIHYDVISIVLMAILSVSSQISLFLLG